MPCIVYQRRRVFYTFFLCVYIHDTQYTFRYRFSWTVDHWGTVIYFCFAVPLAIRVIFWYDTDLQYVIYFTLGGLILTALFYISYSTNGLYAATYNRGYMCMCMCICVYVHVNRGISDYRYDFGISYSVNWRSTAVSLSYRCQSAVSVSISNDYDHLVHCVSCSSRNRYCVQSDR